jgi:hypothetical protein
MCFLGYEGGMGPKEKTNMSSMCSSFFLREKAYKSEHVQDKLPKTHVSVTRPNDQPKAVANKTWAGSVDSLVRPNRLWCRLLPFLAPRSLMHKQKWWRWSWCQGTPGTASRPLYKDPLTLSFNTPYSRKKRVEQRLHFCIRVEEPVEQKFGGELELSVSLRLYFSRCEHFERAPKFSLVVCTR